MNEMELGFFINNMEFPFFIQYGYHSGEVSDHIHKDFIELVVVMDGTATHVVGKEAYPVNKGDVFVIHYNTDHEFRNAVDFVPCNIMFREDFLYQGLHQLKESPGFHALFYLEPYLSREYEFKSRLKLDTEEFKRIKLITDAMITEYAQKNPGWKEMVTSLFMECVVLLCRFYQMPGNKEEQGILLMANALSYIEKNYKKEISVKEIAEIAHMSERHLSRIFQETYHTTPIQYVISLRLLHGAALIKNTQRSMIWIASESGFTDQNYFSRKFKERFGVTPIQYRKQYI